MVVLMLVLVEVEGVWHVREVDTVVLVLRRSCRLVGRLMDGKAGLQVIDLLLERPDNLVLVRASRTAWCVSNKCNSDARSLVGTTYLVST